ncbi:MAG: hypothetical protein UR28_C0038G0011 [Candidatus Peregrinibacteria bacterium GW2011_GWF2_33_10]|nr:MAG: hypothetical protein UR28_C0038G0011 [Candidatus Peregrinibacteria bacterium GW2011_GWF2_33_10]
MNFKILLIIHLYMKKNSKYLAGILIGTVMASSVALAASENVLPKFPQGPIYQIFNAVTEFKLDMSLKDIKSHVLAGDLKETLEVKGVDVEGLQSKFRARAKEVLALNDISVKIIHIDNGAEYQLSSDTNEKFLNRIVILEARAKYFNANHPDAPFTVSASREGNTIYLDINGKSSEAVAKIQDRIPATNQQ